MANPLLIAQVAQLVVKHRRKVVVIVLLPVVAGWLMMFVGLLAIGLLAGVGTSGEAGHQKNNLDGEGGDVVDVTVPVELIEPLRAAAERCEHLNTSLLAAIAATTSGWDADHQDGGRRGLMWLPDDAIRVHGTGGTADPLDARDAITTTAAWLCSLVALLEAQDVDPDDELLAHHFALGMVDWTAAVLSSDVGSRIAQAQPAYSWLDLDPGSGGSGQWGPPVANPHVTSPYSPARRHPVYGDVRAHSGTDLRGACGTPIWAAADGQVTFAGDTRDGYGNWVELIHGSPQGQVKTRYAHIQPGGVLVSAGQVVTQGQVIARVGTTGASTGCHLHFEVRPGAAFQHVDPEPFMAARGVSFSRGNS